MRKALIPAFLLVLGAVVLGSTVFRQQLANAATPFTNVVDGNTSTNPANIHEVGTANVNVTNTTALPVQETNTDAAGNMKVHEQGTVNVADHTSTQQIFAGPISGQSVNTYDVSGAKEVRLYWSCSDGNGVVFIGIPSLPAILHFESCSTGGSGTFMADVPGTELRVETLGPANWNFEIFGRSN